MENCRTERCYHERSAGHTLEIWRNSTDDDAVDFPLVLLTAYGKIGLFACVEVSVCVR